MTATSPVRYRMAGAILLIFLAVLFLPWIFDGAGYEYLQDLEEPIPPRPVFVEPQLPPARAAPDPSVARAPEASPPAPVPEARNQSESDAEPPRLVTPTPAQAPQAASTQRERVGWAVQVGSFGREANAREQMQQLRDGGYPAFIEKASLDRDEVWRVKVGPEVQRDRALKVRDEIRDRLKITGIVVAHP